MGRFLQQPRCCFRYGGQFIFLRFFSRLRCLLELIVKKNMFMWGIEELFIEFHGTSWRLASLKAFNIWDRVLCGRLSILLIFTCVKSIIFAENAPKDPCKGRKFFLDSIRMICIRNGIFWLGMFVKAWLMKIVSTCQK